MPDLRAIPGVELIKVGTWDISTGTWIVTPADLQSVIAAHRAGIRRKPVIKLGHTGPMADAEPALGYVDNLRLTDDGNTLVGDLVNVPASVATLIPLAYPNRSVEALQHYTDHTGRTWPLVLDALSVLGATAPGISTLESLADVGALYGIAASRVHRSDHTTIHRTVTVAAARRRRAQRTLTQKG